MLELDEVGVLGTHKRMRDEASAECFRIRGHCNHGLCQSENPSWSQEIRKKVRDKKEGDDRSSRGSA